MTVALRIVDANANRAREALRVMEEAARFILDDCRLTSAVKQLRHDLAEAMAPWAMAIGWRDTPGDVGTTITTEGEAQREHLPDVAVAAGKRLSEALRAIEEYAKTLPARAGAPGESARPGRLGGPTLASRIEALRYRGYDLEQQLARAMWSRTARQWRLCVLLSQSLCPQGDWLSVARAAIEGGADCLQLREKTLDAGELLTRARALVRLARPAGVSVIVNDRPDVAVLSDADGVHLGQDDLPAAEVRRLVGGGLLVGVSTSRIEEARQARDDGASYCGVGPMFPTVTKHKDVIVGPAYLRAYLAWDGLPHLAIAGVNAQTLPRLVELGVRGVAVSSAICAAEDPRQATEQLLALLGPTNSPPSPAQP